MTGRRREPDRGKAAGKESGPEKERKKGEAGSHVHGFMINYLNDNL